MVVVMSAERERDVGPYLEVLKADWRSYEQCLLLNLQAVEVPRGWPLQAPS